MAKIEYEDAKSQFKSLNKISSKQYILGDFSHVHSQQEFFQSEEERNIRNKIKVSKINLINRKY